MTARNHEHLNEPQVVFDRDDRVRQVALDQSAHNIYMDQVLTAGSYPKDALIPAHSNHPVRPTGRPIPEVSGRDVTRMLTNAADTQDEPRLATQDEVNVQIGLARRRIAPAQYDDFLDKYGDLTSSQQQAILRAREERRQRPRNSV